MYAIDVLCIEIDNGTTIIDSSLIELKSEKDQLFEFENAQIINPLCYESIKDDKLIYEHQN